MRYGSYRLIPWAAIVAAGLTLSVPVGAEEQYVSEGQGNATNGENIFKNGKGAVPACITCHQENAVGSDDLGAPRLAGQYYQFLLKQLNDFGSDRRKDDIMFTMNMVGKGLSDQDKKDVATYLSGLRVAFTGSDLDALKKSGVAVGDIARGKSIVKWGAADRNIPACRSCHDYNGRGAPPLFPMIGQQRYAYLVSQLKSWREGAKESIVPAAEYGSRQYKLGDNKLGWLSDNPEAVCQKGRCNDPMAAMRKVAVMMSDQDIEDAATYLTNAMSFAPGDVTTPYPNLVKAGEFRVYDTTK